MNPLFGKRWSESHFVSLFLWILITEIIKKIKSLHRFGGCSLKIRDISMDFYLCFKVCNLVSVGPRSIKLGQMDNLNVIFHVMVSIYQLVQIWNSPKFTAQFQNGVHWFLGRATSVDCIVSYLLYSASRVSRGFFLCSPSAWQRFPWLKQRKRQHRPPRCSVMTVCMTWCQCNITSTLPLLGRL